MIVKASDALRSLFFAVPEMPDEPEEPSSLMGVWDPVNQRLKKTPSKPKAQASCDSLPPHVKDLVPEWLAEALCKGSVIVMGKADFNELDEDVRVELEVLT